VRGTEDGSGDDSGERQEKLVCSAPIEPEDAASFPFPADFLNEVLGVGQKNADYIEKTLDIRIAARIRSRRARTSSISWIPFTRQA